MGVITTTNSQSFITADYPLYEYNIKLKYQQASFKHLPKSENNKGLFNLYTVIPLNHIIAITANIPMMVDFNVSNSDNILVGNTAIKIQFRNPKWKDRSSVWAFEIVIPFSTLNTNNSTEINDDLTTLPELACITDYSNCHWYLPSMFSASVSYAFHLRSKRFQFLAMPIAGVLIQKTGTRSASSPSAFFNSKIKGIFSIKKLSIITEFLNSSFLEFNSNNNVDIEGNIFFIGTIGLAYRYKCIHPGLFYQINMNPDLNRYASNILGIQIMFHLNKKEKYLKEKN